MEEKEGTIVEANPSPRTPTRQHDLIPSETVIMSPPPIVVHDEQPSVDDFKAMIKELDGDSFYDAGASDMHDQEPWFQVEVRSLQTDGSESRTRLRKAWSEFQRFHYLLLTDEFGCDTEVKAQLPALLDPPPNDNKLTATALTEYFNKLVRVPAVNQSPMLASFLDEKSFQGRLPDAENLVNRGSEVAPTHRSAIGFLLQPFTPHCVYVPRRGEHTRELIVLHGESVVWRFEVEGYLDIDFSVEFEPRVLEKHTVLNPDVRPHTTYTGYTTQSSPAAAKDISSVVHVHRVTRYGGGGGDGIGAVQGSFTSGNDGLCTLRWGNGYSRLRGKRLHYCAEAVAPEVMKAAVTAADAVTHKLKRSSSVTDPNTSSTSSQPTGSINCSTSTDITALPQLGSFEITVKPLSGNLSASGCSDDDFPPSNGGTVGMTNGPRTGAAGEGLGKKGLNLLYSALMMAPYPHRVRQALRVLTGGAENAEMTDQEARAELFANYEKLEDDLAVAGAKRAQAEAQTKVLLARLQRSGVELNRASSEGSELRTALEHERVLVGQSNERMLAAQSNEEQAVTALEEAEKRCETIRRERALLQAERNVWQVARSGIQSELSRVVTDLEVEKQAHADTKADRAKAQSACHRLETENHKLTELLAAAQDKRLVELAHEETKAARAEAEDTATALAEMEAELARGAAHKRILALELRTQRKTMTDQISAAKAGEEEARMMQRAMQGRLDELELQRDNVMAQLADCQLRCQRLRSEKKLLVTELRQRGVTDTTINTIPTQTNANVSMSKSPASSVNNIERVNSSNIASAVPSSASSSVKSSPQAPGKSKLDKTPSPSNIVNKDINTNVYVNNNDKSSLLQSAMSEDGSSEGGGEGRAHERQALIKQITRQLVQLRERQQDVRERLEYSPNDTTAQRLYEEDTKSIADLQAQVRQLIAEHQREKEV